MSSVQKLCPTFWRGARFLWHSPTFTSWGNYAIQSLRLFFITPLILTRFDETEIAAWYLFGSLNFIGSTIGQRLRLSFVRMLAFAMGGASDLSPIKGRKTATESGEPNWGAFERAYSTIGSLNFGLAWLNLLIALGMGWYGLNNIVQGYEASGVIWFVFGFKQLTGLIAFNFQRYGVALHGMNYMALSSRCGIAVGLLSVLGGVIALALGGGFLELSLTMELISLTALIWQRFLLSIVEGGRVLKYRVFGLDRQVLRWAWAPTWKGFIGQLGMTGSMQMCIIIYTAHGTKMEVASFLFATRMMQTFTQISQTPFSTVQPLMSRLLAAGDIPKLRKIVHQRMAITLSLTLAAILAGAIFFPIALDFIDSKLSFMPISAWFLLGFLTLIVRFNVLCCAVSAIGNEMIFYWEMLIAAVVSSLLMLFLKDNWGMYGPIIAALVPMILILNFRPFIRVKTNLNIESWLNN